LLTTPDSFDPSVFRFAPVPEWSLEPAPGDTGRTTAARWYPRVDEVATRLLESDDAISDPRWRRPGLSSGIGAGSRLFFEDHSEIPMSPPNSHTLEYRMSWLARSTDVVGLTEERVPAFERYRAQHGLGRPDYVQPRSDAQLALAPRLAEDALILDKLVGLAAAGGFTIVPYISTRSAWLLAERVAVLCGQGVHVAGPPPDLMNRVNDKLWFARRVRELIGPNALPRTRVASDDRELVFQLGALGAVGGQVVVKVPSGSGGRGIVVCDAASIVPGRIEATGRSLRRQLEIAGWDGSFPLVVGVWDQPVAASPSVQVWVPPVLEGPPIIEAIFDQVLDDARFVGASESTLPLPVRARLSDDAMGLGLLLQRLGYFGQCGFDAVLVGGEPATAAVHWLECNGRWGGVSTAMSALRRLVGPRPDRCRTVVQSEVPLSWPRSFGEVMELLDADLLHNRTDRTGAVILAPRRVMEGTGVNLVVVGRTASIAKETTERILHRLTQR
jgi:hypothetical protein